METWENHLSGASLPPLSPITAAWAAMAIVIALQITFQLQEQVWNWLVALRNISVSCCIEQCEFQDHQITESNVGWHSPAISRWKTELRSVLGLCWWYHWALTGAADLQLTSFWFAFDLLQANFSFPHYNAQKPFKTLATISTLVHLVLYEAF